MTSFFNRLSPFYKGSVLMLLSIGLIIFSYATCRHMFVNHNVSIYDLAFWGSLGGVTLTFPFFISSQKRRKKFFQTALSFPWLVFFMMFFSVVAAGCWFFLMESIPADTISLFDQLAIVWSIGFGVVFLGEKIRSLQFIGLILSAIGFFTLTKAEVQISPLLLLVSLFVPFLYALQSFILKKYGKGVDGFSLSVLRGIAMVICFGLIFGILGLLSVPSLFLFIVMSIGSAAMIFSKALYFEAHEYLPMSQLNFFFILVPVILFFISPFIELDFVFRIEKYVAAVVILLGVVLFLLPQKKTKTEL